MNAPAAVALLSPAARAVGALDVLCDARHATERLCAEGQRELALALESVSATLSACIPCRPGAGLAGSPDKISRIQRELQALLERLAQLESAEMRWMETGVPVGAVLRGQV